MGKTESGAIWLDKKLFSVFDYWQFWRNTDDRDVLKFLKMFTDLDVYNIEKIKNNDINSLKILLANEATSMLHGKNDSKLAEKTAKQTFEENILGVNLPSYKINLEKNLNKITIVDLLIISNLENSKSEVRRLIKGKAIKINDNLITNNKLIITKNLFKDNFLKLSVGKKKHIKIELE